jgi:hypothetical protein
MSRRIAIAMPYADCVGFGHDAACQAMQALNDGAPFPETTPATPQGGGAKDQSVSPNFLMQNGTHSDGAI